MGQINGLCANIILRKAGQFGFFSFQSVEVVTQLFVFLTVINVKAFIQHWKYNIISQSLPDIGIWISLIKHAEGGVNAKEKTAGLKADNIKVFKILVVITT